MLRLKNKKDRHQKKYPKLEDVVFIPEREEISLKEKIWKIEFGPRDIRRFFERNKFAFVYIISVLIILIGALGYFIVSKADVIDFYSTSCLGGWKGSNNATGKPDLPPDSDSNQFNEANSAVLKQSISEIFCGGFKGEAPLNTEIKKVTLKFSWVFKNETESTSTPIEETILIPRSSLIPTAPSSTVNVLSTTSLKSQNAISSSSLTNTTFTSNQSSSTISPPSLSPTSQSAFPLLNNQSPTSTTKNSSTSTPNGQVPSSTPTNTPTSGSSTSSTSFLNKVINSLISILIKEFAPESIANTSSSDSGKLISPSTSSTIISETSSSPSISIISTTSQVESITFPEFQLNAINSSSLVSSSTLETSSIQTKQNSLMPTTSIIYPINSQKTATSTKEISTPDEQNGIFNINNSSTLRAGTLTSAGPTSTSEVGMASTTNQALPPSDDIFQVAYTIDGSKWQTLGNVNTGNWRNLTFEIPNLSWDNLSKIQINIKSLPTVASNIVVYLDSVWVEVEYEKIGNDNGQSLQNPTPPQPKPIVLDPNAQHSCTVDPFLTILHQNSTTTISVNLHKAHLEKNAILEMGGLPFGIEALFASNSDSKLTVPAGENNEIIQLKTGVSVQEGSFNIPIIYTEEDSQGDSSVVCQFNLIYK